MKKILSLLVFFFVAFALMGQDGESIDELFKVNYETPLTLDMKADLEKDPLDKAETKKKEKKKTLKSTIRSKPSVVLPSRALATEPWWSFFTTSKTKTMRVLIHMPGTSTGMILRKRRS